ncbi:hypothetical protein [Butyricicoccus sp. Marseille-Q5471]|uniref:hypothetical protein n=1 Tax=Butyricicoccus sp. Marseille-Q5471 TaxID=3039493 RepID=UPI0024BC07ED|nr:hypothetical protein [Butyricicoccus sp. Marseille-Q5471]
MTQEEIWVHREHLAACAKLLKALPRDGNTFDYCTPELWKIYDGTNPHGEVVYQSFSNSELLAFLTAAVAELGCAPK